MVQHIKYMGQITVVDGQLAGDGNGVAQLGLAVRNSPKSSVMELVSKSSLTATSLICGWWNNACRLCDCDCGTVSSPLGSKARTRFWLNRSIRRSNRSKPAERSGSYSIEEEYCWCCICLKSLCMCLKSLCIWCVQFRISSYVIHISSSVSVFASTCPGAGVLKSQLLMILRSKMLINKTRELVLPDLFHLTCYF